MSKFKLKGSPGIRITGLSMFIESTEQLSLIEVEHVIDTKLLHKSFFIRLPVVFTAR